jgi:hypothetical protein
VVLKTIGRDCLFLNWALPASTLPALAPPLRYDSLHADGRQTVFLSAALFRQQILDIPGVRFPKVSYPQLSLRLCTVDGEGMPSFYLCKLLLPAWVLPSVRLVARQQAHTALFDYPPQGAQPVERPLSWQVRKRDRLEVAARAGTTAAGPGPSLGSWEQAVTYFQRRNRWYFGGPDGLRRLEVESRDAQAVPVAASVVEAGLLGACLAGGVEGGWPALHSAWFSPEIPFVFKLGWAGEAALPRRVPAPG